MRGLGLELEGEPSSGCSQRDILSANIVGWRIGCLLSVGRLTLASRGERNDRGYEKLAPVRDRSPMTAHFTTQQKALIFRLRRQGNSLREIAKQLGCSHSGIDVVLKGQRRGPRPVTWSPRPGNLTISEREQILIGISRGRSLSDIARGIGRSASTVTREVKANGGREGYAIWPAHERARLAARRPKESKLANATLCSQVTTWLEQLWSPQEIANRLKIEFAGDKEMAVSHETIYQSLFVQGRGELKRELARCLRSGRTKRRPRGTALASGPIADMVMISERPPEVEDRAVPGHWEGDLIIGKGGKSAVGTLVERQTRYVKLLHLPIDHSAKEVERAMRDAVAQLPADLAKSVTWDQGSEMARHVSFTLATNIPVYFCDPHSPWQRGSNENTNGLLRQYMPKGTDLSLLSPEDLRAIEASLNGRPRMTLGYMTPAEKYAEVVALST